MNRFFPQKEVKISSFDKKWFSPELRTLHRKKQREFFKNRYSEKFKALNKKFKYLKQKNIQNHYMNLTNRLKKTDPRNYYRIVKQISDYQICDDGDFEVEELAGLSEVAAAEKIAEHFSAISCSYQPVQLGALPSYLPAPPSPQVTEREIYEKIRNMKQTLSTFHISN